jgi:hypothetical protein
MAETRQAIRPIAHRVTSSASGKPRTGSRPVQLGTAVSRKPAAAAITNPNSISWTCHVRASKRVGSVSLPKYIDSHSASEIAAQLPAAKNMGRKP